MQEIQLGDYLTIDAYNLKGKFLKTGEAVEFTAREIDILQFLLKHKHRPVARDELLSEVWGYQSTEALETRTVDIHIAKLRKKTEPDAKNPQYLTTVRGRGYRLEID